MTTTEYIIMYVGFILWFIAGYCIGKKQGYKKWLKEFSDIVNPMIKSTNKAIGFFQESEGRTNDIKEDEKALYMELLKKESNDNECINKTRQRD